MPDSIIAHIESLAIRHPNRIAIVDGITRLSYQTLVRASIRIASQLTAAGVESCTRVGIEMPRSASLIVAILGIIRHGCSYVPLDPAQPESRTQYIVEQAGLKHVLIQQPSANLPDAIQQIVVSTNFAVDDGEEIYRSVPATEISPLTSLYVIFTSGTTGHPKGVTASHHNLMRLLRVTAPLFDFRDDDRWCLFHSPCFDFSVWEIFAPLFHGARLYIVPESVTRDAFEFHQYLREHQLTILNQTPSAFYQLAAIEEAKASAGNLTDSAGLSALRYVIFGGEALSLAKLKRWTDLHPLDKTLLVNMYGITEITVHATFKQLSQHDMCPPAVSNIGRPLPDLDILLLDESGEPVPEGSPGEMIVTGDGVTQGYCNNPVFTAERFYTVQTVNGSIKSAYRSGDLARKLANGEIEYLGRKDRQVKIRGYRIELEEIEAAILQLPAIDQCLVMVKEHAAGDNRLVAFVIASAATKNVSPHLISLAKPLSALLPEHMIPSTFLCIDRIPLNANHKADLHALDKLLQQTQDIIETPVAWDNAIEPELHSIWCGILKTSSIGRTTQFHLAGGDSLLSVMLLLEVYTRWGISLKLRQLEQDFSISSMAAIIYEYVRLKNDT